MSTWEQTAEAYRRSFETLCSGAHERLLADAADGILLDIGCGTGVLAARAASEAASAPTNRRVIAADADPDMAALARPRGLRDVRKAVA